MSARAAKQPLLPSPPAWRTAATVAIVLHLFCLALTIVSNAGGGVSRVGYALRKIPLAPRYLKLLGMDVGYDFDLAGTEPQHAAHRLELREPGAAEPLAVLPPADMGPGPRRQRYQRLAYHVAEFDKAFAENSDLRTMIPLAITERWTWELELPQESLVLSCPRQGAPRWGAAPEAQRAGAAKATEGSGAAGQATAAEDEAIDIDLVWNPWSGHYEASRRQPRLLTAKAIAPARTAPAPNPPRAGADDAQQDTPPPAADEATGDEPSDEVAP